MLPTLALLSIAIMQVLLPFRPVCGFTGFTNVLPTVTSALPSLPRKSYMPYSEADDRELYENRNLPLSDLCDMFGRGERSIGQRLLAFSDTSSSAYKRLFTTSATEGKEKKVKLPSASEVLQRIKYDYSLPSGDFHVTVSDRFSGLETVPFDKENTSVKGRETSFVFAVPESRVEKVLFKERVVWCRRSRLNLFSGQAIMNTMEGYDEWFAEVEARRRDKIELEKALKEESEEELKALNGAIESLRETDSVKAGVRQLVKLCVDAGGYEVVKYVELSLLGIDPSLIDDFFDALKSKDTATAKKSSQKQLPALEEGEIEESFVRGGGAGGQKINKTSSKVVLTHVPTGVTVATQKTRSLQQNRKIARKMLQEQVDLFLNGEDSKVAAKQSLKAKKKANAKRKAEKRRAQKKELENS